MCLLVAMTFSAQELVLEVLQALTSNTQIVKETMQKGAQQPSSNSVSLFQTLSHSCGENWKESLHTTQCFPDNNSME